MTQTDQRENLFNYISGFAQWADEDDESDEVWTQAHVDAVESFNKEYKTTYDFYDMLSDYMDWRCGIV